ncbi:MAG TPA: sigma-70 family RNA polymerase sigma factor [Candidatus Hydrogenedentes bacterium]|nr:sigma-70 family RNA polymerase sigma factor [Candidatus Hydrogenedentota bacterium]HOT52155.1 sigma-70 family RNA polymerase sigma factor [Candidatus Hydrogenedentota bacterium]HOV75628.1 sigma-70 family RNA polymerase sigma factor [Candidatus Hydrogenedentota bacterium]HPC17507.1 sigma-70 family RNA polymerase sigma factor [Candidatus Hydrogenedentota bacterium]HRT21409.1 sigma-70 family RNA polymerase sigma factor [Candidatus Hydrogenedentota bacterium]
MGVLLDRALVYHGSMADLPGTASVGMGCAPDGVLVAHARQGDDAAFEELVRRHRNDVYRLVCRFLHDREEAWDVSQEVFIKAYRALWRFRGEAQFKTWIMHIAANQCRDHLRRRRAPFVPLDEGIRFERAASAGEPDHAAEARELGLAIERALETLPHKHRLAFVLREYEGMSYEEMARAMRCRIGTVMSRLHHARRKLQDKLAEAGFSEDSNHG